MEIVSERVEGQNEGVIAQAIFELRNRLPAAQLALTESFVRQYYGDVAPEDLVGRQPAY